jgi:uncharacterized protein DUF1963
MPTHHRFDLRHWSAQFPLERLRAEAREFVYQRRQEMPTEYPGDDHVEQHIRLMEPAGEILVGPGGLAVNELLRAEAFAGGPYKGKRIATDVFVWARGEPPDPAMTKIGGVPYRPRSLAWPQDEGGNPLRFTAQLCFADSRDIVADLPGDVLLIFGDDDALLADPEDLVFEWSSLGIQDVASEAPQPTTGEPLTPYYGIIHRTEDWPDAPAQFPDRYRNRWASPWLLSVFEGTKIGGIPSGIQGQPTIGGRFLAALGSISASYSAYPVINAPEPPGSSPGDLMIGDMGSLYLFLDRHGRVCAEAQCY